MCFVRVHSLLNLKRLTVNLVQGLFKQCSRFQIFYLIFVERKSRDNSDMLWNKSQDYQVRITLTDHFWLKKFDDLTASFVGKLESCLLTVRQRGSYNSHINRRFSNTLQCIVIVVQ